MILSIQSSLQYEFSQAANVLLQIETAEMIEQTVSSDETSLPSQANPYRISGTDHVEGRIWLNCQGVLGFTHRSLVNINRPNSDTNSMSAIPYTNLGAEAVPYLPSRFEILPIK